MPIMPTALSVKCIGLKDFQRLISGISCVHSVDNCIHTLPIGLGINLGAKIADTLWGVAALVYTTTPPTIDLLRFREIAVRILGYTETILTTCSQGIRIIRLA